MTAMMSVAPTTAKPGSLVDVDGWCLEPRKYDLVTVNLVGYVSGVGSNEFRPLRDGSLRKGINVPPDVGPAKVQIRTTGKRPLVVASFDITVSA